jgi:hypothetical protein
MLARIQTALYRGDADAAWGLLSELKFIRRRSYLRRVQVMPALAIRYLEDATDRPAAVTRMLAPGFERALRPLAI